MSRRKLTETERTLRRDARAAYRAVRQAAVDALREWRDDRLRDAEKRAQQARKAPRPPRGVDRVPERLRGLAPTVEPHTVSKRGTVIDSTPASRLPKRRRHTRTRDLPGAVARRAARAEKAGALAAQDTTT